MMNAIRNNKIVCAIFGVLTIVGIVCWIVQLTQGLQLSSLNNTNFFGLYMILFVLLTGISAGSLLLVSSSFLFESFADFRPMSPIAAFCGVLVGAVAAGLFIFADIGGPQKALFIIISGKFDSPIVWDTIILAIYVVVGTVLTIKLKKFPFGSESKKASSDNFKTISIIAFVAGLLVIVTSFAFSLQVAQPFWNTPAQPLSFLLAAIVAAFAVFIIISKLLSKSSQFAIGDSAIQKLAKLAGLALAAELIVVLSELALGFYAAAGEESVYVIWLGSGSGLPFFIFELILVVAGIILLLKGDIKTVVLGASLALAGVFFIKYNLIQAQLANPLLNYSAPTVLAQSGAVYVPTVFEVGLSLGIVSIAILIAIIGVSVINANESSKKTE